MSISTGKHCLVTILSVIFYLAQSVQSQPVERHPFLAWLGADETRIVIPVDADPAVVSIARRIARAGGYNETKAIVNDEWILGHPEIAGSLHLVVIGAMDSNRVLRAHPSLWARSKEQSKGAFPVNGLFFFGIGDIIGDNVGVVESGRNPYNILRQDMAAHNHEPFNTWRWMLRLTGRTPTAAVAASNAFLKHRILSGIVAGRSRIQGPSTFSLSPDQLKEPPEWISDDAKIGIRLVGWHQVDALIYDGLENSSGARPEIAWRFVYRGKNSSTEPASSPHRRNSAEEILLCRMKSRKDANRATKTLLSEFDPPITETELMGRMKLYTACSGDDTIRAVVKGVFLAIEHIHTEDDLKLLKALYAHAP